MFRRLRFNPRRAAVLFDPVKKMLGDLDLDIAISTAVVSTGPGSEYALVWEYGNIRQTKKGPKTTLGIDIDTGRKVWLTIQAPRGYVRIWRPRFRDVIHQELKRVKWGQKSTKQQLMDAMEDIGMVMADLVKSTVPIDSGDLKASITWLKPRQGKELQSALRGARGG